MRNERLFLAESKGMHMAHLFIQESTEAVSDHLLSLSVEGGFVVLLVVGEVFVREVFIRIVVIDDAGAARGRWLVVYGGIADGKDAPSVVRWLRGEGVTVEGVKGRRARWRAHMRLRRGGEKKHVQS